MRVYINGYLTVEKVYNDVLPQVNSALANAKGILYVSFEAFSFASADTMISLLRIFSVVSNIMNDKYGERIKFVNATGYGVYRIRETLKTILEHHNVDMVIIDSYQVLEQYTDKDKRNELPLELKQWADDCDEKYGNQKFYWGKCMKMGEDWVRWSGNDVKKEDRNGNYCDVSGDCE